MNAGEELNKLVAEHVMGWHWKVNARGAAGWATERNEALVTDITQWSGFWVYPMTPSFSEDIDAAWAVVNNLNARGWRVEIFSTARSGVDVQVSKWGGPHHEGDYAEWAETAPHAICRAALRAVGVEL